MARKIDTDANIAKIRIAEQGSDPASPAAGFGYLYEKTDQNVYFKNASGTVFPVTSAYDPWLVDILPAIADPSATVGTWGFTNIVGENVTYPFVNAAAASGGATIFFNSSSAQNDAIAWDVVLSAGVWNCSIHCRKATNTGIFTLNQDGVSMGTADSYAASPAYAKLQITGWTVSTTGKHTMQLKMATKNGSSSGYLGELFGVSFRRTA